MSNLFYRFGLMEDVMSSEIALNAKGFYQLSVASVTEKETLAIALLAAFEETGAEDVWISEIIDKMVDEANNGQFFMVDVAPELFKENERRVTEHGLALAGFFVGRGFRLSFCYDEKSVTINWRHAKS